jgi:hypothetical protein
MESLSDSGQKRPIQRKDAPLLGQRSGQSQKVFLACPICDRIAFAPRPRRNRTAFLLSREKLSKVALLRLAGCFL